MRNRKSIKFRGPVFFFTGMILLCLAVQPSLTGAEEFFDDLFDVSFPVKSEGWVSGRWGLILHTDDGGKTWRRQETGMDYSLFAICFVDNEYGWAVGDNGSIMHTKNGGERWFSQESPVPFLLMDVCFVDRKNGWAVTEQTHILHTVDGGETWTVQFSDEDYILKSISFTDPLSGWAAGEYGFVYRTVDGGKNWKQQAGFYEIDDFDEITGGNYIFDLHAIDENTAWVVGIDGYVARTLDGGKSWQTVNVSVRNTQLFAITALSRQTIVIAGKGAFVVSTDGGRHWEHPNLTPSATHGWIYGLAAAGEDEMIAVGWDGAIYKSSTDRLIETWNKSQKEGRN